MIAVCDCPTCPDRALIVETVGEGRSVRCNVCGWLMRHLEDEADEGREEGGGGLPVRRTP